MKFSENNFRTSEYDPTHKLSVFYAVGLSALTIGFGIYSISIKVYDIFIQFSALLGS